MFAFLFVAVVLLFLAALIWREVKLARQDLDPDTYGDGQ